MKPSKRLVSIAWHEAGHAVIFYAMGIPVQEARIHVRPSKRVARYFFEGGYVQTAAQFLKGKEWSDLEDTEYRYDFCIGLLAGYEAERIANPTAHLSGRAGDMSAVKRLLRKEFDRDARIKSLNRRARAMVRRYWYVIDLVAMALNEEHRIGPVSLGRMLRTWIKPKRLQPREFCWKEAANGSFERRETLRRHQLLRQPPTHVIGATVSRFISPRVDWD